MRRILKILIFKGYKLFWERDTAFRNYLREHADIAVEYGRLKEELARKSKNRASYSECKTAFITNVLRKIN